LIISELAVSPEDFDAETVLCDHFALHLIWGPDDDFMELETLCFLSVHFSGIRLASVRIDDTERYLLFAQGVLLKQDEVFAFRFFIRRKH
jgi:hypothetical protein